MPYGHKGKEMTPPSARSILIITVWDAVALLWTYSISRPPKVKCNYKANPPMKKFENQVAYLEKMQLVLVEELLKMGERKTLPRTINLTFSTRKGNVKNYFFGVSIRGKIGGTKEEKTQAYKTDELAAKERVKVMKTMYLNVQTEKKLEDYS